MPTGTGRSAFSLCPEGRSLAVPLAQTRLLGVVLGQFGRPFGEKVAASNAAVRAALWARRSLIADACWWVPSVSNAVTRQVGTGPPACSLGIRLARAGTRYGDSHWSRVRLQSR